MASEIKLDSIQPVDTSLESHGQTATRFDPVRRKMLFLLAERRTDDNDL
jgi:hypothetical protein